MWPDPTAMSHLDTEIHLLKEELIEMHRMVRSQLSKCKTALVKFDTDMAKEVLVNERRVNALELKIDRDCENILALLNPVAVDLRFILAALKINSNMERIGDNAEGIARYVLDVTTPFDQQMLADYEVEKMYQVAVSMIDDALEALITEDTSLARKVFLKDDILDSINSKATGITLRYIRENRGDSLHFLNVLSIIRKLERVGDQTKNVAEEIIFYIEAKVLKHGSKI
ncbi:MAG TPA: phosphate signaling complex protein PhoU [Bacteroidia bacterium]|nr:phosphate signaling complex protein PhoU [Bacteroidia bacterium]